MYERKRTSKKSDVKPRPMPARSEEEEQKLAAGYAMDLALEWLREGTAPAQIVTHFLKENSLRAQAELEKLRNEIELIKAKKKEIESAEEQEKRYQEVLKAISVYNGKDQEWEIVEDENPEYR